MAFRTVLSEDQDRDEARKVLAKRFGDARVEFVQKRDFLGHTWTEAIIED